MNSKKWYQSKGMWAGIIAVIVAIYNSALGALVVGCGTDPVGICITLPEIPTWIFAILGAFGVHGRKTASTVIQ